MKNLIQNSVIVISMLAYTGCTVRSPRYIYSPSTPNNPFIQQKGDSKLAAFYSSGHNGNQKNDFSNNTDRGYDLQAAYAFSNHFAVTAGYYYRNEYDEYLKSSNSIYDNYFWDSYVHYKRNLTEVGAGYFFPLNDRKTVMLNLFAGFGVANFSINENGTDYSRVAYTRNYSNSFTKFYFQPSINFFVTKYLRLGFVFKTSNLYYRTASTDYSVNEKNYFYLNKIEKRNFMVSEFTGINIQLNHPRYKWIMLEGAITSSGSLHDSLPKARTYNASIGLTFDIEKLIRKKSK